MIRVAVCVDVVPRTKRKRKTPRVAGADMGYADTLTLEQGKTDQVLSPPYHPYTRLLIASVPELRIGWLEETMETQEAQAGIDRVVTLTDVGCPFFDRCPLAIEGTCDVETPPIRDLGGGHAIECHRSEEEFVNQ